MSNPDPTKNRGWWSTIPTISKRTITFHLITRFIVLLCICVVLYGLCH